jgi:pSer/pThr/pTyr-binding forkhead associated (FHA) protein
MNGMGANAYLEVWSSGAVDRVALLGGRLTMGRAAQNDVVIGDEHTSRLHAVIELIGPVWCVQDLSSLNGTFVNGSRIGRPAPLAPGDEIRIGRTRLVLRSHQAEPDDDVDVDATVAYRRSPRLTHRERDVLLALYVPGSPADTFTETATPHEIAKSLWVTEAAVRHHLTSLYEKFGIEGSAGQRRSRLANEALRCGVITLADVDAAREASKPAAS